MSKLRVGQKLLMWDGRLGPFKAVVMEEGIKALEDICWTASGNKVVDKGYIMFGSTPPEGIPKKCVESDWIYKTLIQMEENE